MRMRTPHMCIMRIKKITLLYGLIIVTLSGYSQAAGEARSSIACSRTAVDACTMSCAGVAAGAVCTRPLHTYISSAHGQMNQTKHDKSERGTKLNERTHNK